MVTKMTLTKVCKYNATPCVELVLLEQRSVRLHSGLLLQGMLNCPNFMLNILIGFRQIEYLAQYFDSLLVAASFEEPSTSIESAFVSLPIAVRNWSIGLLTWAILAGQK